MNVSISIPPFFRPITPGLSPAEAAQEALARGGQQANVTDPDERDRLLAEYHKASELLKTAGAFYAATCLGLINGEPSAGTLVMGLQPLSYADPGVAAAGIHEILLHQGKRTSVSMLDLPCGQAAIEIEQNPTLSIPGALTDSGKDTPVDMAKLQAFIPVSQQLVPGAQEMLVLTFTTPSTDHWPEYSDVLADILRSLRFTPDDDVATRIN